MIVRRVFSKKAYAVVLLCVAMAIASTAQTFTVLFSFNGIDGTNPVYMSFVQGADGDLYGTTAGGRAGRPGTAFKVSPTGRIALLYTFCNQRNCPDGSGPSGLVQATDGNFYGTATNGGINVNCLTGCGTVFKMTPAGTLTTIYSFCAKTNCPDGSIPFASLLQGTDGSLYGTTQYGGGGNCPGGCGTVFKITTKGILTTLHRFNDSDGSQPKSALVQATDGDFYATTQFGGASAYGTVFKISPAGKHMTLHSFDGTDGSVPLAGLVQAADGNFYGTTSAGLGSEGTVFKIAPGGVLTTLHAFEGKDGAYPYAGLVQATDGNFYGTTAYGGIDAGTIFEITSDGTLTTLHDFTAQQGAHPYGGLTQGTDGIFYGTTTYGGDFGNFQAGTAFSLAVGLGPFVETLPNSGKVGAPVKILGTDLTGATGVTFNGVPATFTVVSDTYMTAVVPSGATTGPVVVTTPTGPLTSNKNFVIH